MTPERWQQVKELFHAAREYATSEREDFLTTACNGDEELRREVESLLAAYEQPGNFLEQPAVASPWPQATPEELMAGQQIGPYKIEEKLGQGGMGMVYRARDTRLGRPLALKLLHPHFTQDPERVRRFQQEARAASALNHPNILTIYEGGQVEATHFIATELVEGQTLRAFIKSRDFSLRTALDIIVQVTGALVVAHQAGIVHRDIKPENIMVRADGIVKVLDFGLAKLTELRNAECGMRIEKTASLLPAQDNVLPPQDNPQSAIRIPQLTLPGLVLGTVAYMSPEQARGLEVDARSDLFSLGVVLYELLAGRKPFEGETPSDVMAALLEREPLPIAQSRSHLPADLQRILNRALAKPVEERYQSAQALLDDLKRLKQAIDFSAQLKQGTPDANTVSWTEAEMNAAPAAQTNSLGEAKSQTTSSLRFLNLASRRAVTWTVLLVLLVLLAGGVFIAQWNRSSVQPLTSIAVLPFLNVGNDPQMEYLADGLTESLIDSLMRLSSLRIKARSMVYGYKGRAVDPRQVGKDLGVQAVVIGRVQQQGERPMIRAELVDTADGSQLWSREYRVPMSGLLAAQEEIAREVAAKLQVPLSRQEQSVLAHRQTNSPEAYQLYLEGHYHWNKRTGESMSKSVESFRQAIVKDPNYALAYVGLADAYATLGSYHVKPAKEAFPLAREAAEKALKIDDNLAEAHATMGKIITDYYWDWEQAEKAFQRAVTLNPKYANSHHWYSTLLAHLGRFDEAVREARLALDLDPLSPVLGRQLGQVLYRARRYDEGIAILQKTLELEPRHVAARYYLGLCLLMQGKREEALAAFQKGNEQIPNIPDFLALLGYTHAVLGQRDQALRYQAQLHDLAQRSYVSPYCFTAIALGLDEVEQVFQWLEKCYEERDPSVRGLKTDPLCDPIRSDPRFVALLRRAGLPS